eukprot:TRINITY_DN9567_c0_g1_i1.p1 TRINITY_DN9567_c0_g1~~TRINITY_DN9567_c0_g1_i1.p1  ORF type:complete len:367 (+),score=29.14 TRINITY_DN9567_c0_g1_i1:157-1101(+)
MEIDRVLRPGGFWVLSGPPINYEYHWRGWNSTFEEQKASYDSLQQMLTNMCYKLYAKKGNIAVWQKPIDNTCYVTRAKTAYPTVCDDSIEADAAWYVPIRACLVTCNPYYKRLGVGQLPRWPERLNGIPERIRSVSGGNARAFKMDSEKWVKRVKHYKTLLPELGSEKIRNVMDMNTMYGSFAAALINDPVWVMNVVSTYAPNSLNVVFDRGLIGTYNDWCEAFSTYPRTYDLLHLDGLFTAESHRCEMKFVLLEMDRILRPEGYVIISDDLHFVRKVIDLGSAIRWNCEIKGAINERKEQKSIIICQKTFWRS